MTNVMVQVVESTPGLTERLEVAAWDKLRTCQQADLKNSTWAKPRGGGGGPCAWLVRCEGVRSFDCGL